MESSASPVAKKLKQARLSFGSLAEPSPPKKPRLENQPKPGPVVPEPSPIVLSDDEEIPEPAAKRSDPYVPLVDVTRQTKLKRKQPTEEESPERPNDDLDDNPSTSESNDGEITDSKEDAECTPPSNENNITSEDHNLSTDESTDNEAVDSNEDPSCKSPSGDGKEVAAHESGDTNTPKLVGVFVSKRLAKKLTPREIEKKKESDRKRQIRETENFMRKRKKEREREEKLRLKQLRDEERKMMREDLERLKEERRQHMEIRRECNKIREEDKIQRKIRREEEKRKREEAMEQEKLKKEEEKRRKDEEIENKKKKSLAYFMNFFVPKEKVNLNKDTSNNQAVDGSKHNYLSIFNIKSDMRLAPSTRNNLNEKSKTSLDLHLKNQDVEMKSLYLTNLKCDTSKAMSCGKTWPLEDLKNELTIIEDDLPPVDETVENQIITSNNKAETIKPKLFSFTENRRPPYWGTWRRKSLQVNGRRPFAIDKTYLDYTCDSDEEWEEEEPGESVESIAGSDDDEGDNEYDVDNEFMVPHGYLSDEEALGEDDNALSPETHKAKLKFLEHEFEDEMKKSTKVKQPRLLGIMWQNEDGSKPKLCPLPVWDFLMQRVILSSASEIVVEPFTKCDFDVEDGDKNNVKYSRKSKVPEELIPVLIQLIHGNTNNKEFLSKEFQMYVSKNKGSKENHEGEPFCDISKLSIRKKIRELSTWMPCPDEGPMCSKMCWYVEKEVREAHGLTNLQLPNEWCYTLVPKRRMDFVKKDKNEEKVLIKEPSAFNITKFTKKMTQEEKDKQFSPSSLPILPESNEKNVSCESVEKNVTLFAIPTKEPEKKRVKLLLSGPLGKDLKNKCNNSPKQILQGKLDNISNVCKSEDTKCHVKKKVALIASGPRSNEPSKQIKTNLLTQFIESTSEKYKSFDSNDKEDKLDDCVVLSD